MTIHLALLLTLAGAAPQPVTCTRFLTGDWVGKGEVTGFGTPVTVDNAYAFRRDGSFLTINRYLDRRRKWQEQRVTGTWTATAGKAQRQCRLTMTSGGSGMSASSRSDVTLIGDDVFRSMGFDMKRVRKPR